MRDSMYANILIGSVVEVGVVRKSESGRLMNDMMNAKMNPAMMPARVSGRVMSMKRCHALAPRLAAASPTETLTPARHDSIARMT